MADDVVLIVPFVETMPVSRAVSAAIMLAKKHQAREIWWLFLREPYMGDEQVFSHLRGLTQQCHSCQFPMYVRTQTGSTATFLRALEAASKPNEVTALLVHRRLPPAPDDAHWLVDLSPAEYSHAPHLPLALN